MSIAAANKSLAAVIACKSPVKFKLISSIGTTCEYPPPVAPPFIPNTGPKDGSLKTPIAFFFKKHNASNKPILTVVLPSPNGVGFTAVTSINFPLALVLTIVSSIFALYFP